MYFYSSEDILAVLMQQENAAQRQVLTRFFKCGKGEYGEGDRFIGLKVPQTRAIVKMARLRVAPEEIEKLLHSPWHEVRLCGFLLLVEEMKHAIPGKRKDPTEGAEQRGKIAEFYLRHARKANNWDLVDLSCPHIIGQWLLYPQADGQLPSSQILDRLAASYNLWEQRIAIVSTLALIRADRFDETLRISRLLLSHPHDLIHKAIGWMLRELGKHDSDLLRTFLADHYSDLPRTTLRYAIERFTPSERLSWLRKKR